MNDRERRQEWAGGERVIREYKISSRNSTVCAYPGRDFDWSKFDWKGETYYRLDGRELQAQEAYPDDFLISENCEYLHVPYDWEHKGTIYRVRPNKTMYAGERYRGHLIKRQRAVKKPDGWYWVLELEEVGSEDVV